MFNIQKAESDLAALEQKRAEWVRAGTALADERSALSFAAHADGDQKAKARLEVIHDAISKHASELSSVDAALRVASERLERARQDEAKAADRKAALELRTTCAQFLALAEQADAQAAAFIATCNQLEQAGAAMSSHGLPPSGMQRVSFYSRAVLTSLMGLPQAWRRGDDFRYLGSNERRSFVGPTKEWVAGAMRAVEQRLGEDAAT